MPKDMIEVASVPVAPLHDAFQRAKYVAPTKGAAYDRAAGYHLTFADGAIEVRATNLELTYWHRVEADCLTMENGELHPPMRLPSSLLGSFVGSVPMGSESDRLRFLIDPAVPRQVTVQYGKKKLKAKMRTIDVGNFPLFDPVDIQGMIGAQELSSRLESVAWAVDDGGTLSGTYIDGTHLVSMTTKYAARVVCPIDAVEPVVAVMKVLTPLIKLGTDIKMRTVQNKIIVALDEQSQVTSTVIKADYPTNVLAKMTEIAEGMDAGFVVNRSRLIEGLNRLLNAVRNDRVPRCTIEVVNGSLALSIRTDVAEIEDACVVSDQRWAGAKVNVFQPNWLIELLSSYGSTNVRMSYVEGENFKPWYITDPQGEYETWIMPMADVSGTV